MRRLPLLGIFGVLLVALYFLWQHRFERCREFPSPTLAELRATAERLPPGAAWVGSAQQPALRLRVDPEHPEVVTRLSLPLTEAVDFLHLRFRVSASGLVPGREIWEDGRGLIEWHPPGGGADRENDFFGSARYDQASGVIELVIRPDHPPAIPVLRLENIGTRGDFELSTFEATVLRERWIWKIGRGLLLAGWLGWAVAWIGPQRRTGWLRPLSAAAVWLLMGIYFVIPGPWKDVRSLAGPFQFDRVLRISPEVVAPASALALPVAQVAAMDSPVVKSVGELPPKGDFTLRLKLYAKNARSLLHILMLLMPTLAIACLVGRSSALSLGIILSLSIEAAQTAFGFGFDWVDVFDLGCDALGIAAGLWIYAWMLKRRESSAIRVAAPFTEPPAPSVAGGAPN
jgi:hypothetical protein